MKNFIILFIIAIINFSAYSQNPIPDSLDLTKNEKPHKRYSFGGTPILAFDSDLGLKYGAAINLFDYGNIFPNYLQYAKIKAFHTTNGNSNLSLTYDNNSLFKKTKFIFESTLTKDVLLNFYGFNGANANFSSTYLSPENQDYINPYYYSHQRKMLRLRLDFQKKIGSKDLFILYGFNFNKFMIDETNLSAFDIPLNNEQMTLNTTTLYQDYVNSNLIPIEESKGGVFSSLKLGITYDSRDNQINCSNGVFIETYIIHSPKLNTVKSFTKHIVTFRQYYRLKKINTLLTYRISSQQKLGGTIPFYYLPTYHDIAIDNDGVGGAFNLRGVSRNRIAANGFVTGNIELRKNIFSFNLLKQHCNIELSGFTDLVYITQKYNTELNTATINFINSDQQQIDFTYGLGLYLIYGTNNIISINYGISPNKNLGTAGLYVGSSFLF